MTARALVRKSTTYYIVIGILWELDRNVINNLHTAKNIEFLLRSLGTD